jgi:hypothetical protein
VTAALAGKAAVCVVIIAAAAGLFIAAVRAATGHSSDFDAIAADEAERARAVEALLAESRKTGAHAVIGRARRARENRS